MRGRFCVFALLLMGCDDHLYPAITGGPDVVSYPPTWEGTQRFFGDQCESCHPTLSEPSLDQLFDDVQQGNGMWIVPFEPQESELWLVLRDQSDINPLMPQSVSQPLPDDVIGPIREWILAGAALN